MEKLITQLQIKTMHKLLAALGEMAYKQDYMDEACIDGRFPTSSKQLYEVEAEAIIQKLQALSEVCNKMRRKVISKCREAGMEINGRPDMDSIEKWVLHYGHAKDAKGNKKPMNKYTYKELVTLVTQARSLNRSYLERVNK